MNHHERMDAALHFREPDHVPRLAHLTPPVYDAFKERTGSDSPEDYWDWDVRGVGFKRPDPLPDLQERFGKYHADRDIEFILDWIETDYPPEWGVGTRPAHFYHLSAPLPPMESFTSVEQVQQYPFPDYVGEWRHDHLEDAVSGIHERGYWADAHIGWIFQTAWTLRSEVALFSDFYENPDIADALFSKITDIRVAQAVRLTQAGVDSISLNDDIGAQKSMILSPKMWREWLKPHLARLIAAIREVNPDVCFRYHSDGYYVPVIEDLIDIGVTSLRTVQAESMDLAEIKRDFGDRIAIEGTIGLQSELHHGTPQEVRAMIKEQCALLKPGGGWVASPGNGLTPDIPMDNIMAMFAALDDFGNYS